MHEYIVHRVVVRFHEQCQHFPCVHTRPNAKHVMNNAWVMVFWRFRVHPCATPVLQEDNAFQVSTRENGPSMRPLHGTWWADRWEAKKVMYARFDDASRMG